MPDLNAKFYDNNISTNEGPILYDSKDIVQSLDRLFLTKKGSVPFNRNFGTSLYNMLFENENNFTQTDIGLILYRDLTDQEPRVYINPYGVTLTKLDNYTYQINLTVYINGTNSSIPYSVQINKDS